MLTKSQKRLRCHVHAVKQGLNRLWRTPWTTGVTVLVIAVTLILPLLFWFLMGQVKPLTRGWQQGKEIALYLDMSTSAQDAADVLQRVRLTPGVKSAELISAETSLHELEQQEGMQDVRRYLPENPLPAMIEAMPTEALDTPERVEQLFQTLKAYPEVEQARLNREWVMNLHAMFGFLRHLSWFLGGLFGLMVVFIIRNLLRLSAQEHHEEIQVLKLIGATDAFILRPFLYTGVCLGGLGAVVAFLGMHTLVFSLSRALHALISPVFNLALPTHFSVLDGCWFMLLGMGLGWLGAYVPLKHQLGHIEPGQ